MDGYQGGTRKGEKIYLVTINFVITGANISFIELLLKNDIKTNVQKRGISVFTFFLMQPKHSILSWHLSFTPATEQKAGKNLT